ncbi:hypothetical protein [Arcobacter arenosus]|nr:hypothetical protein [Arcobacter arenosus]
MHYLLKKGEMMFLLEQFLLPGILVCYTAGVIIYTNYKYKNS